MRWTLRRRLKWIWTFLTMNFTQVSMVGNRVIYKGMAGDVTELTITARSTNLADGYERTELLEMLKVIRIQEETQQWKVPEPVRCAYCRHCSPTDEQGFCPVIVKPHELVKGVPCICGTHTAGLDEAMKMAIDRALTKTPFRHNRPINHDTSVEEHTLVGDNKCSCQFTRNPAFASTGSLQDG